MINMGVMRIFGDSLDENLSPVIKKDKMNILGKIEMAESVAIVFHELVLFE